MKYRMMQHTIAPHTAFPFNHLDFSSTTYTPECFAEQQHILVKILRLWKKPLLISKEMHLQGKKAKLKKKKKQMYANMQRRNTRSFFSPAQKMKVFFPRLKVKGSLIAYAIDISLACLQNPTNLQIRKAALGFNKFKGEYIMFVVFLKAMKILSYYLSVLKGSGLSEFVCELVSIWQC